MRVLYIARGVGRHERVTEDVVREKYAVEASQYADFATLRGDASDGLPGVAGVGDKTAATLLQRFGSMAGILAAVDDPDSDLGPNPRSKLRNSVDYLAVAPQVVAVARDIDLGRIDATLPREPQDPDAGRRARRGVQPRRPGRPADGDPRGPLNPDVAWQP